MSQPLLASSSSRCGSASLRTSATGEESKECANGRPVQRARLGKGIQHKDGSGGLPADLWSLRRAKGQSHCASHNADTGLAGTAGPNIRQYEADRATECPYTGQNVSGHGVRSVPPETPQCLCEHRKIAAVRSKQPMVWRAIQEPPRAITTRKRSGLSCPSCGN
jgi:hypothetical protein